MMGILKKEEAAHAASLNPKRTARKIGSSVREERDSGERFPLKRNSTTVCIPCIPKSPSGASAASHSSPLLPYLRIWNQRFINKPFIPYL